MDRDKRAEQPLSAEAPGIAKPENQQEQLAAADDAGACGTQGTGQAGRPAAPPAVDNKPGPEVRLLAESLCRVNGALILYRSQLPSKPLAQGFLPVLPQKSGAGTRFPAPPEESSRKIDLGKTPAAEPAVSEFPRTQPEKKAEPELTKAPPTPLSDEQVLAQTAQKWKYKAVPFYEPEPVEEIIRRDERYAASRVVGARVRGKKHKHEGTNCDDWFEIAAVDDVTLAAVADGAGSRRFSRIGARVSCEAAVEYLRQEFSKLTQSARQREAVRADLNEPMDSPSFQTAVGRLCGLVQDAVAHAVGAVEAAWMQRQGQPGFEVSGRDLQFADFASTLLVAVAVPTGSGEHLLISCQVGDGTIAALDTAGPFPDKVRLLGEADSGEFSGQTEFITSDRFKQLPELQSRTRVYRGRSDLVMLMTDGVADDYHPAEKQLPHLYYDLIANGVLERAQDVGAAEAFQQEAEALPEPAAYPWVNNQDISVALHYSDRICGALGLSAADLWNRRGLLAAAHAKLPRELGADPSERLAAWLDNYVRRGSFDDRTLVLLMLDGGGQCM